MTPMTDWLAPFQSTLDAFGFIAWVLVFPVYHLAYPRLRRLLTRETMKDHLDAFRRSWIEGILERRDIICATQQTRNLTMSSTLLASSALILLGFAANIAVQGEKNSPGTVKIYLLMIVLAVAFSYFIASLRYIGMFNVTIGADPKLVDEREGSAVDYFTQLVQKMSARYTMGVRAFYSVFPLFLWVFDPWLFVLVTLGWAVKFMAIQDFTNRIGGRK